MEHAFGLDIPRTLDEVCDPRRLALLVYDMQVGVVSQLPDGAEVTRRVAAVLRTARVAGVRTFFTRHMWLPLEVAGVAQLRTALAWQRVDHVADLTPGLQRDSPGFQIVPELAPRPSEAVFDKITMSAFEGTPLDIALRDCGIVAFAVVGVALEIGIEPTVVHGDVELTHLRQDNMTLLFQAVSTWRVLSSLVDAERRGHQAGSRGVKLHWRLRDSVIDICRTH